MSEEQIKNILGSINYEVETDKNWVEPIGLDRDAWKALLKYIQQKENIIKEVREYAKNDDNFFIIDAYSQPIVDRIQEDILEILDKDSK